jgi:hypothetical protein
MRVVQYFVVNQNGSVVLDLIIFSFVMSCVLFFVLKLGHLLLGCFIGMFCCSIELVTSDWGSFLRFDFAKPSRFGLAPTTNT